MNRVTDADGFKVYYYCPECGDELEGCPDPACVDVYHHKNYHKNDDGCHFDVPIDKAVFTGRVPKE